MLGAQLDSLVRVSRRDIGRRLNGFLFRATGQTIACNARKRPSLRLLIKKTQESHLGSSPTTGRTFFPKSEDYPGPATSSPPSMMSYLPRPALELYYPQPWLATKGRQGCSRKASTNLCFLIQRVHVLFHPLFKVLLHLSLTVLVHYRSPVNIA